MDISSTCQELDENKNSPYPTLTSTYTKQQNMNNDNMQCVTEDDPASSYPPLDGTTEMEFSMDSPCESNQNMESSSEEDVCVKNSGIRGHKRAASQDDSNSSEQSSDEMMEDYKLPVRSKSQERNILQSPLDLYNDEELSKQFDARLAEIDMEMSASGDLSTAQALSDVYAWNYLNMDGVDNIPTLPLVEEEKQNSSDEVGVPAVEQVSSVMDSSLSETEKSILSQTDSEEICDDFYAADNELISSHDMQELTYGYLGCPQLAIVSSSDLSDFKSPLFGSEDGQVRVSTDSLDKNGVLTSTGSNESDDRFVTCNWDTPKSNYTLMFDRSPIKSSDDDWDRDQTRNLNDSRKFTTWSSKSCSEGSKSHSASEHSDDTPSRSSDNTSQHTAIHRSHLDSSQNPKNFSLHPSAAQKLDLFTGHESPNLTTWGQLRKTVTTWKDVHKIEENRGHSRSESLPNVKLRQNSNCVANENRNMSLEFEDNKKRHSFTLFEIFQRMKSHESSMESHDYLSPGSQNLRWSLSPSKDLDFVPRRITKTVATSPLRDISVANRLNNRSVQTSLDLNAGKINKSLQTSVENHLKYFDNGTPTFVSSLYSRKSCPENIGGGNISKSSKTSTYGTLPRRMARSEYFSKNVLPNLEFLKNNPDELPPAFEKLFKSTAEKPHRSHSANCCDWLNSESESDELNSSDFRSHVHHLFEDARVVCHGEGKAYLVLPAKRFTSMKSHDECFTGCKKSQKKHTDEVPLKQRSSSKSDDEIHQTSSKKPQRNRQRAYNLQLPCQSPDKVLWNMSFESSSSSGIDTGSHSSSPRPLLTPAFSCEHYSLPGGQNSSDMVKQNDNFRETSFQPICKEKNLKSESEQDKRFDKLGAIGAGLSNSGNNVARIKPQNPQVCQVVRRPLKSCLRRKVHSRSFSYPNSVSKLADDNSDGGYSKQRPVSEVLDRDEVLLEMLSQADLGSGGKASYSSLRKDIETCPKYSNDGEAFTVESNSDNSLSNENTINYGTSDKVEPEVLNSDKSSSENSTTVSEEYENGQVRKSVSFAKEVSFRSPLSSPFNSPHHSPKKRKDIPSPDANKQDEEKTSTQKVKNLVKESVSPQGSDTSSDSDCPPKEFIVSPTMDLNADRQTVITKYTDRTVVERELVLSMLKSAESILTYFMQTKDPLKRMGLVNLKESPAIGDMVINQFCPVIYKLVMDGLKTHIYTWFGRVKNNVWLLVEDSCELGPSTRSLHELICDIQSKLSTKSAEVKFCAFIFGLLNMKSLDFWLQHLHRNDTVLSKHYEDVSFMTSANSSTQKLFSDTLTAIQPLTVLPFNLKLEVVCRLLVQREYTYQMEESQMSDILSSDRHSLLLNKSIDSVNWQKAKGTDMENKVVRVRRSEKIVTNNEILLPDFVESSSKAERRKSLLGSLVKQFNNLTASMPVPSAYKKGVTEYEFDMEEIPHTVKVNQVSDVEKTGARCEYVQCVETLGGNSVSKAISDVTYKNIPANPSLADGPQVSTVIIRKTDDSALASSLKSQENITNSIERKTTGSFFGKFASKAKSLNKLGPGLIKMFDTLILDSGKRRVNPKKNIGLSQSVIQKSVINQPIKQRQLSLDLEQTLPDATVSNKNENSVNSSQPSNSSSMDSKYPFNEENSPGFEKDADVSYVCALCDHSSAHFGEISFNTEDFMKIIKIIDSDWIKCRTLEEEGIVRKEMIRFISDFELFMFLHGDFYT